MSATATASLPNKINVTFKPAVPVAVPIRPRPLASIDVAICELDMSAAMVRASIDEGKLAAFDIAPQRPGRPCLRILWASIEHYRLTQGKPFALFDDWPQIFKLVWPLAQQLIQGTELARCLCCDRGHVENLINAHLFRVVKPAKRGPGGSPIVTVASFESFLKGRLII